MEDVTVGRASLTLAAGPGLFSELALARLGRDPGIRVVGQARDEDELDRLLARYEPRVLLLETEATGPGWIQWISRTRRAAAQTRVLVLSGNPTKTVLKSALSAGGSGVVRTQVDFDTFHKALRAVATGEIWAARDALGPLLEDFARSRNRGRAPALTAREGEVRDWVTRGLRNKEIARRLQISEKTVKNHLHSIFQKRHVDSRFALGLEAMGQRLPRA